mmetsp:Transcript_22076/g.65391  ORF Transcript_22076/g.65391 Transcript_22076/m.65391 type:complete len:220 (+) Transcript_22076:3243-3902(+)
MLVLSFHSLYQFLLNLLVCHPHLNGLYGRGVDLPTEGVHLPAKEPDLFVGVCLVAARSLAKMLNSPLLELPYHGLLEELSLERAILLLLAIDAVPPSLRLLLGAARLPPEDRDQVAFTPTLHLIVARRCIARMGRGGRRGRPGRAGRTTRRGTKGRGGDRRRWGTLRPLSLKLQLRLEPRHLRLQRRDCPARVLVQHGFILNLLGPLGEFERRHRFAQG